MPKISKIIIAISTVYVLTILLYLNPDDKSWAENSTNYYKIIAGLFLITVQFFTPKQPKKD
ncbi:MAG: hypothetical protein KAG96_07615 [Ichthyobacteriaceae bacterium]|nr:hypothetical protein [Ichthyobacteriaceae bacterium]